MIFCHLLEHVPLLLMIFWLSVGHSFAVICLFFLAAFQISLSLAFYSFSVMFLGIHFNLFYGELSYGFKLKFMSDISGYFFRQGFLGHVVYNISRNGSPRESFSGHCFCNICYPQNEGLKQEEVIGSLKKKKKEEEANKHNNKNRQ